METLRNYIGVKQIRATPMTRLEYNNYRGWEIPDNENPDDSGYLVVYPDGYESWSPEKQFKEAYREIYEGHLSFGLAIEALKKGLRVARHGWNGKDMFLFLLPAGKIPVSAIHDPALRKVIQEQIGDQEPKTDSFTFDALASIRMWTADKKVLTGWLASQTDILSDDYFVVK